MHTMKACEKVEILLHSILSCALDGASAALPPAQAPRYALVCRLSGFRVGGSILKREKFLVLHCV